MYEDTSLVFFSEPVNEALDRLVALGFERESVLAAARAMGGRLDEALRHFESQPVEAVHLPRIADAAALAGVAWLTGTA